MAIDIWPYSGRSAGAVSDLEHEALWAGHSEGVLPGQASTALAFAVNTGTRAWTVQPGDFLIRGHLLRIDTVQSGTLASNAGAGRIDVVVAFIDRTSTPWTKGIAVRQGIAGAGRPALQTSLTGRYEVALADVQVLNTGAASIVLDYSPKARPPTQTFGPGVPVAAVGAATSTTVCSLVVPAVSWDRILMVTGACYIQASQTGDTHSLHMFKDGVQLASGGGSWRGSMQQTIDTPSLPCTPFAIAAGVGCTLTIRAARYFGVGTWTTQADSHLNHIDVLAIPV